MSRGTAKEQTKLDMIWNRRSLRDLVAADVSPLTSSAPGKLERTHIGCYGATWKNRVEGKSRRIAQQSNKATKPGILQRNQPPIWEFHSRFGFPFSLVVPFSDADRQLVAEPLRSRSPRSHIQWALAPQSGPLRHVGVWRQPAVSLVAWSV